MLIAWISFVLRACAICPSADGCRNGLCACAVVRLWVGCKPEEYSKPHLTEHTSGAKISSRRDGMNGLDWLTADGVWLAMVDRPRERMSSARVLRQSSSLTSLGFASEARMATKTKR